MKETDIEMRNPHTREILKVLKKEWRLYVLLLPMVLWFAMW